MLLGQRMRLSNDTRLHPKHVDFLINKYRSRGIREEYGRNQFIDPAWLQDMGVINVTPVNSGDDPLIPYTSKTLGKFSLPEIVSLPMDKGIYRVAYPSNLKPYYYTEMNMFFGLVPGSTTSKFDYYFRVGVANYISPCAELVRPIVILENPLDGYVLQTEFVGQDALVIGESFTVYGTQIVHNTVSYNPGDVFTATATTFSGNGKVMFTELKRRMTDRDPYPIGMTLLPYITMGIFTQEFRVEKEQVADVIDDAQDQTLLIQNADSLRQSRQSKETPPAG